MYSWMFKIIILTALLISGVSYAADPSGNWKTLHTEHFLIHHLSEYADQAKRSAIIAEKIYPQMKQKFYWEPEQKITMVITDEYDLANGSATPFPFNLIYLRLSPPDSAVSLDSYDDWLTVLIEHELTHVFHIDKGRGKVIRARNTFGRFLLFFPNIFQPGWFIEGLATYHETHQGIGRGQSSSFEMLMRDEVNQGLQPVSQVNLPPESFPLNRQYLYGVYFFQFLEEKYGEDTIDLLVENYSDNLLPFSINSNSKQVLGKDITELWNEFSLYLTKRFEKQLNILEQAGADPVLLVSDIPIVSTDLQTDNDGALYYIEDNLESKAHLLKYQNATRQVLTEVNSQSHFKMGADQKIYITQVDFCDEYRIYYDLYRYDLKTNNLTRLSECKRYKKIAVNKESNHIAAVSTISSVPKIDLLNHQGKYIKTLWTGKYGDVINEIDWSIKRNRLLVTKKELNKAWGIYELDVSNALWHQIISNQSLNMQAKYNANENGILYTSDQSGVFNIYQYDFTVKESVAITNVNSGAFSPVQKSDHSIYYLNYSDAGYKIYQQSATEKQLTQIKSADDFEVRYEESMLDNAPDYKFTKYTPWPDLKPRYWLPLFVVQDQGSEVGFATSSNDALQNHFYELNLLVGVDQEELLGSFYYHYDNWLSLVLAKENTVYSDSVTADTDLIRANTQAQVIITKPITSIKSQWKFGIGYIGYNDKDIYRATGVGGFADTYDDLLGISVFYNSSRHYLKGNSPESGRNVLFSAESSDVFESDYQGQLATLEWREFLNLGTHNTLALRYIRGAADSTMRPFRLGGLKTEWDDVTIFNPVASRDIFNKRYFALRGYQDNTQTGNNIELLTAEWRFPISFVERGIMTPPIGIMKHSGRLFAEAGASWNDDESKNVITSAGAEWVVGTNLFYFYNLQLRFGFAKGLDESGDEFYYAKVGSSF